VTLLLWTHIDAMADTSRHTEEVAMAVATRKIEMEHTMNERKTLDEKVEHVQRDVAVLQADVTHIQSDITELKADVKRVEAKVDDKFGALNTRIDEKFGALNTKIDEKFDATNAKMEAKTGALDEKIDRVAADLANHRVETEKSFGVVRQEISNLRVEMKDGFALVRREISGDRVRLIGIVVATVGAASALGNYIGNLARAPANDISASNREDTRRINSADPDLSRKAGPQREPGPMIAPDERAMNQKREGAAATL
jgi:phage host-nuclease inhibitor protein Gam